MMCVFSLMVSLPILRDNTLVILNEALVYIPIPNLGRFLHSWWVNRFCHYSCVYPKRPPYFVLTHHLLTVLSSLTQCDLDANLR